MCHWTCLQAIVRPIYMPRAHFKLPQKSSQNPIPSRFGWPKSLQSSIISDHLKIKCRAIFKHVSLPPPPPSLPPSLNIVRHVCSCMHGCMDGWMLMSIWNHLMCVNATMTISDACKCKCESIACKKILIWKHHIYANVNINSFHECACNYETVQCMWMQIWQHLMHANANMSSSYE